MVTEVQFTVVKQELLSAREAEVTIQGPTFESVTSREARNKALMIGQQLGLSRAGLDPVNGLQPYPVDSDGNPVDIVQGGQRAGFRVDYKVKGM